jgi:uncharacterized protein involved in response to NO
MTQLFASPFRIFFVSTAGWAVLAAALWLVLITGQLQLPLGLHMLQWHQHEMLFGFLNAAVAGFVLTAVCAWTNTDRLHGLPLFLLWLVWLAGRLAALFGESLPAPTVAVVNLAFLPLVMLDAGRRIWQARQQRQIIVLLVIALLWLVELGLLLEPVRDYSGTALIVASALMLVIGGRITPAFSRNWLRAHQRDGEAVVSWRWLEATMLASLALLLGALLLGDTVVAGAVALLTALLTLLRTLLWRGWLVREEPLLWTLHLSLLWIPFGLALLAATCLLGWPASAWKHAISFGAMGLLILTVMARVAQGHTGRPLQFLPGMAAVWWLLLGGAAIRVAAALGWLPWLPGISAAALAWCVAFSMYLWRYLPVLSALRPDGKPG